MSKKKGVVGVFVESKRCLCGHFESCEICNPTKKVNIQSEAKALAEAIRQNIEVLNVNLMAARQMNMQVDIYACSATSRDTRGLIKEAESLEFAADIIYKEEL